MINTQAIPLDESFNLATHLVWDEQFKQVISINHPVEYASIVHFSKIAGNYCPRVILACEQIIKSLINNGTYNNYKSRLSTRNSKWQ